MLILIQASHTKQPESYAKEIRKNQISLHYRCCLKAILNNAKTTLRHATSICHVTHTDVTNCQNLAWIHQSPPCTISSAFTNSQHFMNGCAYVPWFFLSGYLQSQTPWNAKTPLSAWEGLNSLHQSGTGIFRKMPEEWKNVKYIILFLGGKGGRGELVMRGNNKIKLHTYTHTHMSILFCSITSKWCMAAATSWWYIAVAISGWFMVATIS